MEEWIKKMWYKYEVEYYSAIRRDEIMPFSATWVDLDIITLGEVSKKEKDRYYIIYMQNLKYDTNDCYYRTETQTQRLTSTENRPRKRVCQGGGVDWEFGISRCKL